MFKAHINGDRIQTCKTHCFNVAEYAMQNVEGIGIDNISYLCGLLHDAGKCTEEFNNYIEAAARGDNVARGSVIHSFAGLNMILTNYHNKYGGATTGDYSNLTAELIAITIGSHHGLFDVYNESHESGFDHRLMKQPEYDKKAEKNFYGECASKEKVNELFAKSSQEVEKLSNKIAELIKNSANPCKQEEFLFYLAILERLLLSALVDGDRRDTAEFMSYGDEEATRKSADELNIIWGNAFNNLMQKLNNFPKVTDIQCARQELSDYCQEFAEKPCGIYRLNLPTGSGKTLSSLRYALAHAKKFNKEHIIFAIPLLSILEQNADVIRDAVGNDEIILEHHSNIVQEDDLSEENLKKESLIDTWDSPIIITTLVQLLNTMFDGKMSAVRRFHNLSNSVIIIDEVQSVPIKMLSLFNMTLNFLSKICNTTILLCSATQPLFENIPHKLLVDDSDVVPNDKLIKYKKIFKRTRVQYLGDLNDDEIIEYINEYYQKYNSVLMICNTKKEAKEFFLKAKAIAKKCVHLSTSMCVAHRRKVIKNMTEMLKNNEPFICVSTQLIEAGVDVSFGAVIRIVAGIDSIAQAAGRGNRNGEFQELSPVGIVFLNGENLSKLKEIERAQNATVELIAEYEKNPNNFEDDLISDSSIKYYYETLFKKLDEKSTYYCLDDGDIWDYLSCDSKNVPENDSRVVMRQAFKTASDNFEVFDNSQTTLIVPFEDGKELINDILSDKFGVDIIWTKNILKNTKNYTVNLYDYQIKKLDEQKAIIRDQNKMVLILNPEYYDGELGVVIEKGEKNEWSTLIL